MVNFGCNNIFSDRSKNLSKQQPQVRKIGRIIQIVKEGRKKKRNKQKTPIKYAKLLVLSMVLEDHPVSEQLL